MFINSDERRTLIEWISDDPFCMAKAVIVKTRSVIGNHYHKEKNEKFLLLQGYALNVTIGDTYQTGVHAPALFDVPKGAFHSFELEAGSILLGVANKPHDPEDEIRLASETERLRIENKDLQDRVRVKEANYASGIWTRNLREAVGIFQPAMNICRRILYGLRRNDEIRSQINEHASER